MDEKMGDSVKITVIATGFQRDSLPEFERRSPHFPFNPATAPEVSSTPAPELPVQPQIKFPEPVPEPAAAEAEDPSKDDVEVPAILRKRRVAV